MKPAFAAVASLAAIAITAPAGADTLIDNVAGLTLAADGRVQRFSGILVDDNGRIQQIFQPGDKQPLRVDYRLDGKGRVLMPGLIDSHLELMRLALSRIAPAAPGARPRPEDRDQALIDIQKPLLERGITTVVDMGTTIEDWQAYRRAGDAGTLSLRIIGYADSVDDMVLIAGPRPTPWLYEDRLRLAGLRISFTLPPPAPPVRRPARATPRPVEPSIQLKNLLSRAGIDLFHPAVSLRDAAALPGVLDAIEELALTYKGDRRWRIDMQPRPTPPELSRMGMGGMALTTLATTGEDAQPVQSFALTSVKLRHAFGSGTQGALPSPFARFAMSSPREHALAAQTVDAAWAAFSDGRIGRLTIGQRADFILVDRDPLIASSAELAAIRVLQTWVGGRMVYRAPDEAAPRPTAAQPPVPDR